MGFYCSKSSHLDSSSTFSDLLVTPKKGKWPKMVGLLMILLTVQVSIEYFLLTGKSPFHLKLTCRLSSPPPPPPLNPIWSSCFFFVLFFLAFIPPLLICQLQDCMLWWKIFYESQVFLQFQILAFFVMAFKSSVFILCNWLSFSITTFFIRYKWFSL